MASPYVVIDSEEECLSLSQYDTKQEALDSAVKQARHHGRAHYVYEQIATAEIDVKLKEERPCQSRSPLLGSVVPSSTQDGNAGLSVSRSPLVEELERALPSGMHK